jgi:hypothetical protein
MVVEIIIPLYFLISIINTISKNKKTKDKAKISEKKTPLLYITWKKTGILIILWIVAVVLHNLTYAFFLGVLGIEFEEPVFFLIANVVIPLYFIISIIYTLYKKTIKQK